MDFSLTDEQQALADLAGQILGDRCQPETLRDLERSGDGWSHDAWSKLTEAGLAGVAVPERHSGLGFGLVELCLVLEQVGRHVAPVPLLASAAYGGLALAQFGTDDQQARWLPGVADGSSVLTAALAESGLDVVPHPMATRAEPDGDGWRIRGEKSFVPFGAEAAAVLVPAAVDDTYAVFIVAGDAPGLVAARQAVTNHEPHATLTFDGVPAERLGGPEVLEWLLPRAVTAHCAVQAGVCEGALRITAGYVSEREQFGTKIGTFQAVGQRAADAYIDTDAVRITMLQAAWLLSGNRPAAEAVEVAKFWAGEGAQRVVHAAQHLHGGIGVDLDYSIHRYFRWAKVHELALGAGTQHLLRLGHLLASG